MSEICKWLHEQLEQLPLVKFRFNLEKVLKMGYISFMKTGKFGDMEDINQE